MNPHNRPIQLKGFRLSDRHPKDPSRAAGAFQFVFPELELKPGQVVVIFNGFEQKWAGPVGDATRAPETGNDRFHGAFVFTMGVQTARVGFSNSGDYLLLTSPGGEAISCVKWGDIEPSEAPPAETKQVEEAPAATSQSVQREAMDGDLLPHPEQEGARFSPGWSAVAEAVRAGKK